MPRTVSPSFSKTSSIFPSIRKHSPLEGRHPESAIVSPLDGKWVCSRMVPVFFTMRVWTDDASKSSETQTSELIHRNSLLTQCFAVRKRISSFGHRNVEKLHFHESPSCILHLDSTQDSIIQDSSIFDGRISWIFECKIASNLEGFNLTVTDFENSLGFPFSGMGARQSAWELPISAAENAKAGRIFVTSPRVSNFMGRGLTSDRRLLTKLKK